MNSENSQRALYSPKIGRRFDYGLREGWQSFAVTRERIRQIEAKALRKLRHPSRSRKLKAFLDATVGD